MLGGYSIKTGGGIVYAKDWEDAKSLTVSRYGKAFDINTLYKKIAEEISAPKDCAGEDIASDEYLQKLLDELKLHSSTGIGTVYLVTLSYFIFHEEGSNIRQIRFDGTVRDYGTRKAATDLTRKNRGRFHYSAREEFQRILNCHVK